MFASSGCISLLLAIALCSSHPTPPSLLLSKFKPALQHLVCDFSRFADTSLFFAKHIIDSGCHTTDFEGIGCLWPGAVGYRHF